VSQDQTASPTPWLTNEDALARANQRFHNDPRFHARVTMAERATTQHLETGGISLTRSYRVAIRMAAMLGLYAAEVTVDG
jgi:hypothetical protein